MQTNKRWLIVVALAAVILLPQIGIYGPSLTGRAIFLPLDVLRVKGVYLPDTPAHTNIDVSADWVLSDLALQTEQTRHYAASEIRAGRLPLWNPFNYCGVPFLANQSEVFSPFQALYYLWPHPITLVWMHLLKAMVAGIGVFLFLRGSLKLSLPAALWGAAAFPLAGGIVLWQGFAMSAAYAWLPLLLWATDRVLRNPGPRSVGAAAVIGFLLWISGDPGSAMVIHLAAGLYFAWHWCAGWSRATWRSWANWRPALFVATGWAMGFLLAAPLNLPTIEYMLTTQRVAARLAGIAPLPPIGGAAFAQLLFPNVLGSERLTDLFLGPGNIYESAAMGYIGALTILILLPLAWSGGRRHQLWFWTLFAIFAMAFIAGIPVIKELSSIWPLKLIRANRMPFLAAMSFLVIGALAVDSLARRAWQWRPWFWLPLGLTIGAGVWLAWRAVSLPPLWEARLPLEVRDKFQRMYAGYAVVCLVVVVCWLGILFDQARRGWFVAVFLAIAMGELIWSATGATPQADPALYYPRVAALDHLAAAPPGRICGVECLPPNLNLRHRLSDIRGYDAADPVTIVRLLTAANPRWQSRNEYALTQWYIPRPGPIMNMLNLRYLIYRDRPFPNGPPPGTRVTYEGDDYYILENMAALPRPFVPRAVASLSDQSKVLHAIAEPFFDPAAVAYVEGTRRTTTNQISGNAAIVREEPGDITLRYDMSTPGLIVMPDLYYNGWRATVDGRPAPVLRANAALQGIEVPVGQGTVRLIYRPGSFIAGLWIASGVFAALAGWIIIAGWRRRQAGRVEMAGHSLPSP